MTTSTKYSINIGDLLRGLLVAVLTPVFTILITSIDANLWTFDWRSIGGVAVSAFLGYILKNFLTPARIVITDKATVAAVKEGEAEVKVISKLIKYTIMANKKPSAIHNFLAEMLFPMFLLYGKQGSKTAIQKAIAADEDGSTANMVKLANISLYPVVDTILENWAAKTKTPLDDKTVDELKELQEELAAEGGYELPNLDDD